MSQMSSFFTANLLLSVNRRTMPTPNAVIADFVVHTWKGENPAAFSALDDIPMQAHRKQPARISVIATDFFVYTTND